MSIIMTYVRKLALVLIILGLSLPAHAQETSNVTFIHGLGGDFQSLQTADNELSDEFLINTNRLSYSSGSSIPTIAATQRSNLLPDPVVVGHSMGGVVAREMFRSDAGSSDIQALITSGSPHKGALIADRLSNGDAQWVAGLWIYESLEGIRRFYGIAFGDVIQLFLDSLTERIPLGYLNYQISVFQANNSAYSDLETSSGFISTLNNDPSATLPSAHYAIHGVDERRKHLSLFSSFANRDYEEVRSFVNNFGTFNAIQAFIYFGAASVWYQKYLDHGRLQYYINSQIAAHLGEGFLITALSVLQWQEIDWLALTQGFDYSDRVAPGDALLPKSTAAPAFISSSRHIMAENTNHLELRDSQEGIRRIGEAFRQSDIAIPLQDDGGDNGDDGNGGDDGGDDPDLPDCPPPLIMC